MAIQGAQFGSGNTQENYFAPVTRNLFVGGFDRLSDVCFDPAPLARELDLDRFTGREWLIGRIDAFIQTRRRGYIIVQAEAGVGKSTLAAHLVATRRWLHHFTRLPGGRSPEAARKSLAAQLIASWDLADWAPEGVLPAAASRQDWFGRLLEAAARRRDEQAAEGQDPKPIVLVVDGLDEAEPEAAGGRGLPLGLPENLPDGVYVLATSRFGIDRALHAVRNPADWLEIEVEGADNLDDMRRFLDRVTSDDGGDATLLTALRRDGVDAGWFRANAAQACAGVWIYLRYVLDEIRDGTRSPRGVADLPQDLGGFYAEQVERWRGAAEDETAQRRWEQVRLPLLGVLGAARAPLTVAELAAFATVPSPESARVFIEEAARAFLSRRDDDPSGTPRYALRHQSLRDMLTGNVPPRPDLAISARLLSAQVGLAHERITATLTPPGEPGLRDWDTAGSYARQHLPAHAAASGGLDALASDPGFLLIADPAAMLAQRANMRSAEGKRAFAAFELSLHAWDGATLAARIDRLAVNAARMRAVALTAACANTGADWPVLWATWPGQGHRSLVGHQQRVYAVALGRAGDRDIIVSGSADATVRVWDAATGDPVGAPLTGHDGEVQAVALGRAGDRDIIVSGSADATVRVWDAVTGDPVGAPLTGHDGEVRAIAIGRAGDRDIIVSASNDMTIRIWDAVTREPVGDPLTGHRGWVHAAAVGRAGNRDIIVSGSYDRTVRVWDAVTGDPVGDPLTGHQDRVNAVAVGRAGDRDIIVSSSDDRSVRVWDAVTGDSAGAPLTGHGAPVFAMAVGSVEDRDVIVSGVGDGTLRIWDAGTGDPVGIPLTGRGAPVFAVAVGRAGNRDIIVSGADATVLIWDAHTGDPLAGHQSWVRAVAMGRAGNRDIIVSGSYDGTVRIWDAHTGDPVGTPLTGHDGSVNAIATGRAGNRDIIVTGSADATVRIWDAATGDPVGTPLTGHDDWVNAVAAGRGGSRDIIVSGSSDHTVRIWDAHTGDPVGAPLTGHDGQVHAVALGRAGDRDIIVSASRDKTVRIWDAATGDPVGAPLTGHDDSVDAVAVGRAGDRDIIITSSNDSTVRIWDATTGDSVDAPLTSQRRWVTAVALGRAGNRDIIVTGSYDGTMGIWDAATGNLVGTPLTSHQDLITAVALGHAGDRDIIASGSSDRTVLVREHRTRRPER
jgi:WD40 repeat protein